MRTHSRWLRCHFDVSVIFIEHVLIFWQRGCSRLILYFLWSHVGTTHFIQEDDVVVSRRKELGTAGLTVPRVSLLLRLPSDRTRKHIHV